MNNSLSFHAAVRTRFGQTPFLNPIVAEHTWQKIKKLFPDAYAAVIMPNHFHLLTPAMHSNEIETRLAILIRALSHQFRLGEKYWEPISPAICIPDEQHLHRQIRYIHLNPCRKKLVSCPIEWKYSTHRHGLGLCLKPWRGPQKIIGKLAKTQILTQQTIANFHRYVSSDPSCNVQGTPLPTAALPETFSKFSLQDIQQTVQSLSPLSNAVRRKLLFWLMEDQGFHDREVQSQVMGVGYRRIQQLRHRPGPKPHTLQLLRTVLNDSRLRNNVGAGKNFVKSEISPL